ncbi:hypothetical protein AB0M02_28915 [Actinoplanes sp. NPDC051861]|uniref:hypothetical protein n=1 Tax=Actinoplanes sp. NPDC051861 TaxID=3155170 RepID=UPI003437D40F
MSRHPPEIRSLWLACVLIVALISAIAAGILSWAGGMNPPMAVLAAAGAFSGSALLLLSLLKFALAAPE